MYNAYIQPSHSCKGFRSKTLKAMPCSGTHYCPSSETQGSGFWLVPEKHKFSGTNQKPERRRPLELVW